MQSEAISALQRVLRLPIRCNQMQSEAIRGNQMQSEAISALQRVLRLPIRIRVLRISGLLFRLFRLVGTGRRIGALALDPNLALDLEARAARCEYAHRVALQRLDVRARAHGNAFCLDHATVTCEPIGRVPEAEYRVNVPCAARLAARRGCDAHLWEEKRDGAVVSACMHGVGRRGEHLHAVRTTIVCGRPSSITPTKGVRSKLRGGMLSECKPTMGRQRTGLMPPE